MSDEIKEEISDEEIINNAIELVRSSNKFMLISFLENAEGLKIIDYQISNFDKLKVFQCLKNEIKEFLSL